MQNLLTSRQAADLLHLHVKRVQALARSRKLPAVRVGHKWLFPRRRLLALLGGDALSEGEAALDLSARNRLRGRVTAVAKDGLMAEVRMLVGGQELVSVITRSSVERLRIRKGDEVVAVIKATEVMIGKL